ncbi:MAG: hypothetical protein GWO07_11600 [Candidatus Dadabacteria bacterium]|nr:hypothetical protein [Candidatus Dadabacteria bacterium]NIV41010.1 hypothetical protein [Candidatus Dadabacteria bacterium]NIX15917.1 hypothetical protein [Candidatus Dadabacteria bacterium]
MNRFSLCLFILTIFISGVITSCNKQDQNKPEDVLKQFLAADLVGDHKKAYSFLSSTNKNNKPFEQYVSEKSKHTNSELANLFIENTTHLIENVEIDGDNAKIRVDTTTVDLEIITKEVANASLEAARMGKSFQDIQDDIVEKYKKQALPLNNYKSNHTLIKEKDGWKVLLNY